MFISIKKTGLAVLVCGSIVCSSMSCTNNYTCVCTEINSSAPKVVLNISNSTIQKRKRSQASGACTALSWWQHVGKDSLVTTCALQ